jgi:hypothetical protein
MKKTLLSFLVICFINTGMSQDKSKIETFGKQMFSIIKNEDTLLISEFLPTKQDLLDFMESSTGSNESKKTFLKRIDSGLEKMNSEIYSNIEKVHDRAIEEGIIWENAKYSSTEINHYPKPGEPNLEPIKISINFTYYGAKFRITTGCISTKKGTLLAGKFIWPTN